MRSEYTVTPPKTAEGHIDLSAFYPFIPGRVMLISRGLLRGQGFTGYDAHVALTHLVRMVRTIRADRKRGPDYVPSVDDRKILLRNKIRETKTPRTESSQIGIEIECLVDSRRDLDRALVPLALRNRVGVGDDGSISGSGAAVEIRVLAPERELEATIQEVCAALKVNNARVNKSCGLHVHIDCRATSGPIGAEGLLPAVRNRSEVYDRLVFALPLLLQCVAPSRRANNPYCRKNRRGVNPPNRYYAINNRPNDTIEVRLHQGTVDPTKIAGWVRLLLEIADGPDIARLPLTLDRAAKALGLTKATREWVRSRIEAFDRRSKWLGATDNTPEGVSRHYANIDSAEASER